MFSGWVFVPTVVTATLCLALLDGPVALLAWLAFLVASATALTLPAELLIDRDLYSIHPATLLLANLSCVGALVWFGTSADKGRSLAFLFDTSYEATLGVPLVIMTSCAAFHLPGLVVGLWNKCTSTH